jgi:hypothetical protein
MRSIAFYIAFVALAALVAADPAVAQRTDNLTIGVRPLSHRATSQTVILALRAREGDASAAPYVLIGAIVGAAIAALWEARAVSRNGGDFVGTGGLLWIPPVAGAVVGGFGGWLVFKAANPSPAGLRLN